MVRGGETGLTVAPGDPAAMAKAVATLLEIRNTLCAWPSARDRRSKIYLALGAQGVGDSILRRGKMRLRRLRRMGIPELTCRGRQEASKCWSGWVRQAQ